jgi:CRISPR-associated protein Cmr2
VQAGLEARRPVGPALHAAISEALTNFALHVVPAVVKRHRGTLIYAGGDDVLALLPTSTALVCARELRRAFSGAPEGNGGADRGYYRVQGRDLLMMGPAASLSGGLAVVHYKEDLRFALDQARRAEHQAKEAGRDALQMTVCRRSGEHSSALCPWEEVETVTGLVEAFLPREGRPGASDRWAYHLAGELATLRGLDAGAMRAEVRRQVNRAEQATRRALGETETRTAGELVGAAFDRYRQCAVAGRLRFEQPAEALAAFVTLCQTASFLARGRDPSEHDGWTVPGAAGRTVLPGRPALHRGRARVQRAAHAADPGRGLADGTAGAGRVRLRAVGRGPALCRRGAPGV